jgi:ribosomal protein L19
MGLPHYIRFKFGRDIKQMVMRVASGNKNSIQNFNGVKP